MAIDASIYDRIDTDFGQKLGSLFNPALIAERDNRLAALAQENQMNSLKMQQAQQEMKAQQQGQQANAQITGAVSQGGGDMQKAMENLMRIGTPEALSAAKKIQDMMPKPNVRDANQPFNPDGSPNIAFQNYQRSLKPAPAAKEQKLQFSESQGGFIEPPSAQNPQGRIIPVQGFTPKTAKPGALSATAQKELFEADDTVQAAQNVKAILGEAAKINDEAYSGYMAKPRAYLRSNLPFESKGADATIQLDNMMTGQALESLKLIFGGMPTEGERKILLEMQASADKTPGQRKDIINRAMKAAERREASSVNKAKALRAGTYFSENPQDQPASAPVKPAGAKFLGFE